MPLRREHGPGPGQDTPHRLGDFLADIWGFVGWRAVPAGLLIFGAALVEGVGLALLIPLFETITAQDGAPDTRIGKAVVTAFDAIGVTSPQGRLAALLGAFALLIAVRGVVIAARTQVLARLQIGFIEVLQLRVLRGLAAASWETMARLRHARVAHALGADIQRINGATSVLLQAVSGAVMLVVLAAGAVILAPVLGALAIALFGGLLLLLGPTLRRTRRVGQALTLANLERQAAAGQFLAGLKAAISQNRRGAFIQVFEANAHALSARQIDFYRQQTVSSLIFGITPAVAGMAILYIGFVALDASAPVLLAFLAILSRMSGPASQISQGAQAVAYGLPAYEAVRALSEDLAAAGPDVEPAGAAVTLPEGPVELRAVTYRHPGAPDEGAGGVSDVSCRLEPGEFVGVVGPSGAGKSTFVDLLASVLEPQAGTLLAAGVPLKGAALSAWRDAIAYVSQDPFVFHGTVRANLLWGAPQAGEDEIARALAATGADAVVARLPQGLETLVGERGATLSGGERQRLALSGALLRKPRLLLLDESTNAIDVESERVLLERLAALKPTPTVVMVAHRTESLAVCGRLLRFEAGRLVED